MGVGNGVRTVKVRVNLGALWLLNVLYVDVHGALWLLNVLYVDVQITYT